MRERTHGYTATVTNDWNGNITAVAEVIPGSLAVASSFSYDNPAMAGLTSYSIGGASFSADTSRLWRDYNLPRTSRAMTMRWISLVPSPISQSLASR